MDKKELTAWVIVILAALLFMRAVVSQLERDDWKQVVLQCQDNPVCCDKLKDGRIIICPSSPWE